MVASRLLMTRVAPSLATRTSRLPLNCQPSLRRWFASYPPHEVVGMPSLSPTMEAGAISAWTVAEGASFGAGDVLCSIETDKATMDFEAQDEGVVAKILTEAGDREIACGTPILVTVENEGDVAAFADFVAEAGVSSPAAAVQEPAAAATPPPPAPAAATPAPVVAATGDRIIASPLAHTLAKEMGHNLATIRGTGPGGRVIAADVREFVAPLESASATPAPAQAAISSSAAPPVVGVGYTDYALSDSARETAARLAQSKRNVPHYYLTVDLTMDSLLEMRSTLNASLKDEDTHVGVYELLLKAAAVSMKAVPSANAAWMDSVVRVYDKVDINVAVGNGDALYTPVLQDAASRGVSSLSKDLKQALSAACGEDEMGPNFSAIGTMTVMNLGMYGIKSCAPIIREPQACALALGVIENRIVPSSGDELYKESVMMTATMSFDHRVVDGAVGAQWLAAFKSHVENPSTLLL